MVNYPNLNRYQNMSLAAANLRLQGVTIVGRQVAGKDVFVSSVTGAAANNGLTPAAPVLTLGAAVALVTANQGDRIVLLPAHAESISSSTALTMSVAGIDVIGLGNGVARPTITIDTANNSTINVSANSVTFDNIIFVANFLSIAACFVLTTAKDFKATNCEFRETSNVLNFLNIVKSTGAANTVDGLTLNDNKWFSLGTTSVNSFVLTANDIDRLTLLRNKVVLQRTATAAALVTVTAGVLTDVDCGYNYCNTKATATTGGSLISVGGSTSTGFVYENFSQTLTTTTDLLFTTTAGLAANNNRVSGVIGAQGFPIPAVDS